MIGFSLKNCVGPRCITRRDERRTDQFVGPGRHDGGFISKTEGRTAKAELVADEFLRRMSDVLTYALLCEEAAWTYVKKHDGTKLLVCRGYHARVWPGEFVAPSFSPGALLRHFNRIVQATPIPPALVSNQDPDP